MCCTLSAFGLFRFSKENKSSHPVTAYQPFGVGPRNCIGMRFAQLEIKMTLIEVLRNYRITTTPDTKVCLDCVRAGSARGVVMVRVLGVW